MRNAPSVEVALGASRIAGVAIGVATLATLVIVLLLPVPPWLHALTCAVVLAWSWETFRVVAVRTGSRAVTLLHLGADRLVVVHRRDGRVIAGHLRSATYVAATLTAVVWRPDGAAVSRTVLILPDMLPREDFRRLRILLRYARSGARHGAPLSQA